MSTLKLCDRVYRLGDGQLALARGEVSGAAMRPAGAAALAVCGVNP
jgi:hypothetical protein